MLALQVILILSGNLSFLNWLTIVPIVACFDDGVWGRLLPAAIRRRAEAAATVAEPSRAQGITTARLGVAIALLSVPPLLNLLSGQQVMNTSFTRLPLVNTYGAFGSVGRERNQLVFEGTMDDTVSDTTVWRAYAFKCQPVDPGRRPCWMSPYHYRLDWLLWFAAMGSPRDYDWTLRLIWNLLGADPPTLRLLADDPFQGRPPRHIRVDLYRYRLAPLGAPAWWQRERLGRLAAAAGPGRRGAAGIPRRQRLAGRRPPLTRDHTRPYSSRSWRVASGPRSSSDEASITTATMTLFHTVARVMVGSASVPMNSAAATSRFA